MEPSRQEPPLRPLTTRERELVERLLEPDFPGRDELRRQLESVTAKQIFEDGTLALQCGPCEPAPVRCRVQKTTYDDGTTTQYAYDGPGNLTSVTDQAGNVVQYTYDAANQLQSVIQLGSPSSQNTTSYAYDAHGNLTNRTDANSHTTVDGFDVLNRLTSETLPAGPPTQTRTYDPAGNLLTLTDYNGHTTTYTYDALNRLLCRTPDPSLTDTPECFTYTATGKRASMTDASGTTTYTYDNLDRLMAKATPEGTLSYTYDAAGNVASMNSSNANGISVSYTYDSLNRLATVVDNRLPVNQNTTTYSYDPASNLATVTYPNGLSSTFNYDDLNRLKSVNGYQYQLGPTGNRQSATEPGGRTLNWSYDGIYRLTQETISLDPRSKNGSVTYGLDPVGNRLSQTSTIPGISTDGFTYDANDRLSTEQYDNNGNTIQSGARTFAYDFENRLKSMNSGGVTIVYDGDGSRVEKTVGGLTTRYLVDDLNPTGYAQVVEELVGGVVSRKYAYGLQRISQNQLISGTWTASFYGYDGGGSVRSLTDSAGAATDAYDYDAWGNVVSTTGPMPNLYLYRGEQYDPDLNLYYLRARYFNPLTGRFLTRDCDDDDLGTDSGNGDDAIDDDEEGGATSKGNGLIGPTGFHQYLFGDGNPVNNSDPTGHQAVLDSTLLRAFIVTGAVVTTMAALKPSIGCIWNTNNSWLGLGAWVDNLAADLMVTGLVRGQCSVHAFAHRGQGTGSWTGKKNKHQKGQGRDKRSRGPSTHPKFPPRKPPKGWKGPWDPSKGWNQF